MQALVGGDAEAARWRVRILRSVALRPRTSSTVRARGRVCRAAAVGQRSKHFCASSTALRRAPPGGGREKKPRELIQFHHAWTPIPRRGSRRASGDDGDDARRQGARDSRSGLHRRPRRGLIAARAGAGKARVTDVGGKLASDASEEERRLFCVSITRAPRTSSICAAPNGARREARSWRVRRAVSSATLRTKLLERRDVMAKTPPRFPGTAGSGVRRCSLPWARGPAVAPLSAARGPALRAQPGALAARERLGRTRLMAGASSSRPPGDPQAQSRT